MRIRRRKRRKPKIKKIKKLKRGRGFFDHLRNAFGYSTVGYY